MTMRRRYAHTLLILSVFAALSLTACAAAPRLFVNKDADLSYYKRIAVLSFANLANDPYAGERVTRAFITQLYIAERFDMVDPSEFRGVLDRAGGLPDAQGFVDPGKLKDAAAKVQATAIIRGTVTEYQLLRSGSQDYPVVSFTTEMVDAADPSKVVWRIEITRRGRSRLPLVGGSRSFAKVTRDACREAVAQLQRSAF
jgi:hypothetical protein